MVLELRPANVQYETVMGWVACGVSSDASDAFPHLRGEAAGFGARHARFGQFQAHHARDPDARAGEPVVYLI